MASRWRRSRTREHELLSSKVLRVRRRCRSTSARVSSTLFATIACMRIRHEGYSSETGVYNASVEEERPRYGRAIYICVRSLTNRYVAQDLMLPKHDAQVQLGRSGIPDTIRLCTGSTPTSNDCMRLCQQQRGIRTPVDCTAAKAALKDIGGDAWSHSFDEISGLMRSLTYSQGYPST